MCQGTTSVVPENTQSASGLSRWGSRFCRCRGTGHPCPSSRRVRARVHSCRKTPKVHPALAAGGRAFLEFFGGFNPFPNDDFHVGESFLVSPSIPQSAGGGSHFSPARRGWVKEQRNHERRRCGTLRFAYPKTYFGSNSIPCFFNNATNSASKSIFL